MPEGDLLEFIQSVSGDSHLAIEEDLGRGFVRLKTAEAERRQAKHDIRCVEDIVIEMLRNSRDAQAHSIYLATGREGDLRSLVFIDDGVGIPDYMHEAIFEPRVTSKLQTMVMDNWGVHGRGMALYSIKSNAIDARVASSAPGAGSAIYVLADTKNLTERTDQSSMPVLDNDEHGTLRVVTGPHNIARMVIECAIDMKTQADIYLGSHAEIAATLVRNGRRALTDSQLLFCDNVNELPVTQRLAAAADALDLVSLCSGLGLGISERTAHRILSGQIAPCEPILNLLAKRSKSADRPSNNADLYKDRRGLKISKDDLADFARSLEQSFSSISSRYYIELVDEPIIRVGKDSITVKFPFDKEM